MAFLNLNLYWDSYRFVCSCKTRFSIHFAQFPPMLTFCKTSTISLYIHTHTHICVYMCIYTHIHMYMHVHGWKWHDINTLEESFQCAFRIENYWFQDFSLMSFPYPTKITIVKEHYKTDIVFFSFHAITLKNISMSIEN